MRICVTRTPLHAHMRDAHPAPCAYAQHTATRNRSMELSELVRWRSSGGWSLLAFCARPGLRATAAACLPRGPEKCDLESIRAGAVWDGFEIALQSGFTIGIDQAWITKKRPRASTLQPVAHGGRRLCLGCALGVPWVSQPPRLAASCKQSPKTARASGESLSENRRRDVRIRTAWWSLQK